MGSVFNPIPPTFDGDLNNDYLNAVDNYIDEMWLQEKFEKALEKEKENASKRRVGQANERL
jgi:hypothetical protein